MAIIMCLVQRISLFKNKTNIRNKEFSRKYFFHPCKAPDNTDFQSKKLAFILGQGQCIRLNSPLSIIGDALSGCDFSGATLKNIHLNDLSFKASNLNGIDLEGSHIENVGFDGADLQKNFFKWARITASSFAGANLNNSILTAANIDSVDFRIAKISASDFTKARGYVPCFDNADLSQSDFSYSSMEGASFDSSDLVRSILFYCNFQGSSFRKADLSNSNLQGSNFLYSNFESSILRDSDCQCSNFSFCSMIDADLSQSNLRGCNFYGANLKNSNLSGANLEGVNLENANLEGVCWDKSTMRHGFVNLKNKTNVVKRLIDTRSAKTFIIAEDHIITFEGTKNVIGKQYPNCIFRRGKTSQELSFFIAQHLQNLQELPDLLITDINHPWNDFGLPNSSAGLADLKRAMDIFPELNIEIHTAYPEALLHIETEFVLNHLGGFGVVDKSASTKEAIQVFNAVLEGRKVAHGEIQLEQWFRGFVDE